MDTTPRINDSDNNLLFKIAASLSGGGGSGSALTVASGDARYVLKAGDAMTGALSITQAAITADAPSFSTNQTWNNAAVAFTALKVSITNTASSSSSLIFDGIVDAVSRLSIRRNSTTTVHRQEADANGCTLNLSKRGRTGDATGAIANASAIGSLDTMAWDGTSQATVGSFRLSALEDFTSSAHGALYTFSLSAIGAASNLTRVSIAATAMNLQNGCALQYSGVAALNPLTVYATGTVYTITATSAGVDFGTTDPILTVNAAGTYLLRARVKVALNGATFSANRTLTVKLRRTNNTAADVADSTTTWIVPIVTTITDTLAVIELPEVIYTTTNANDTIQIFADISTLPSAGTISIDEASIVAIRTNP